MHRYKRISTFCYTFFPEQHSTSTDEDRMHNYDSLKCKKHIWFLCGLICWCIIMIHLTHWGRVTQLCVSKLTSIASDNGLLPGRHQAIIWNNAGILLIGPLGTNFGEILIEVQTFSLQKIRLKMSSAKFRPFCLGLNVLNAKTIFGFYVDWYVDDQTEIS